INAGVNDFIDSEMNSTGGEGYLEIMNKKAQEQAIQMLSQDVQDYKEPGDVSETDVYISDEQVEKAKKIEAKKNSLSSSKAEAAKAAFAKEVEVKEAKAALIAKKREEEAKAKAEAEAAANAEATEAPVEE
ncbi:MAG: hypothetical protein UHN41_00025, partial [Bacteroidales bacterium]|nr:hypothetical protein [Bacteroidales bacterium]